MINDLKDPAHAGIDHEVQKQCVQGHDSIVIVCQREGNGNDRVRSRLRDFFLPAETKLPECGKIQTKRAEHMIIGAVMVPHPPIAVAEIGKGEEKKIQKTLDSFAKVSETIAELKPDTIVMITPHVILYRDWFNISEGSHAYGDFSRYGAGSVKFETDYDETLSRRISELCEAEGIPAGTQYDRDHDLDQGTMVPLYFINQKYRNYKLVRIGQSGLPLSVHYRFGMCIRKAAQESDKRILIVASGDLSHCEKEDGPYGY